MYLKVYLDDIFGKQTGSHFEASLVDAELPLGLLSQMSDIVGIILKEVVFQVILSHNFMRGFASTRLKISLFVSFQKHDLELVLILVACSQPIAVRQSHNQAGGGVERMQALISHLQAITAQHQAELEKAIVGRGEWHFCQQYAALQIPESVWFTKMKPEAKTKHLKKVQSCQVKQISPLMTASTHENTKQPHIAYLSVLVENAGLSTISYSTLSNIWNKAEKLVLSEGHILKVPWLLDEKARLVKSSSSPQPHVQIQ